MIFDAGDPPIRDPFLPALAGAGTIEEETIMAVKFIRRFLLHIFLKRFMGNPALQSSRFVRSRSPPYVQS